MSAATPRLPAPFLILSGISKRFGPVRALDQVSFSLDAAQIHALLGENGAGKSTLMRIAYGLERPDAGSITVDGVPRRFRGAIDARRAGIGMVHQHFTSVPAFSVAENVALTVEWSLKPRVLHARVRALAEASGLPLDPQARAADLSAGLKQRLEILKALAGQARALLLDEPSSVLAPEEVRELLGLIRDLRQRGTATVLITHKLDEALAVADRITVLRRGEVAFAGSATGLTRAALARYMLGEEPLVAAPSQPPPADGPVLVRGQDLVLPPIGRSGPGVRNASFTVRGGEVVGIAAVEGNGQRELLRAIAGLVRPAGGALEVRGQVGFIPEDRTTESLIGDFSLTENIVLSQGRDSSWVRGPWLSWARARQRTIGLLRGFDVRAASPDVPARALSGGNQQRLVIAAVLERRPAVLVAENPTRGLDLKATGEVLSRLAGAARAGLAVIVHSSDLDELLLVSDRIVTLADGRVTELPRGTGRDAIGSLMLAGKERFLP